MGSSFNLRATATVQAYAVTVVDDAPRGDGSAPATSRTPPSVVVLPSEGDVVGGVYRLSRLLGAGNFGKVYVAQREDVPEHQVALKILPRSHYVGRNVERELVMLATVGHPNVVQLKDHGMTAEYVWLTMPVYRGETLDQRLERGPLSLEEAHEIFVAVARGLEALHAAGLRHQDIKPENLFLAQFGGRVHPILLDLGVAAEREATFVAGTALYASPEQLGALRGKPTDLPLSEKMDTYCLAATLLVSLVGRESYPGTGAESLSALADALEKRARQPLAEGTMPDVKGAPREKLEAAFQRWLALDPPTRPSMTRMAEELEVLREPARERLREEERAREKQRVSLQRMRVLSGGFLLVVGAAVLVGISERETIQLAAALDRAKAQGKQQYDNLRMCNAAGMKAERALGKCRDDRDEDRRACDAAMEQIKHGGTKNEQEHAQEMLKIRNEYAARQRACEEGAATAERDAAAERERLEAEWSKARAALVAERDAQKALAEERAAKLQKLEAERDQCGAERKACIDERDSLRAAESAAPKPPDGASSAGTTLPAADPSAAPTAPPATTPPPTPPGNNAPHD